MNDISSLVSGLHATPAMGSGVRIAVITALAWAAISFAHHLIRSIRVHYSNTLDSPEDVKRIATLGRVFRYIASVIITVVAGMLVLGELGISIAPILGAAGVVGVAVGFGAQSLVKDFFSGFFLLLENQIRHGDVVEVAGKGGVVEEMTLRYVQLRDYDGNVHFVPNGTITTVTNMTRGHAYAVIDAGIAYREDIDEALTVMASVGRKMRQEATWQSRILEDVEVVGVEKWADSAVILRCRFKVAPIEQWNVRREFLRRLKYAFDSKNIEIPYPHLTLYPGQLKDGTAPALHLDRNVAPRS